MVEKFSFQPRQTTGHARTNKERSFTARVDRMDPVVNDDIRLG